MHALRLSHRVGGALNFDRSLEEAARSLGAGTLTTFRRITLPIVKGGVISGAVFSLITRPKADQA